jgi:hypothetical protein
MIGSEAKAKIGWADCIAFVLFAKFFFCSARNFLPLGPVEGKSGWNRLEVREFLGVRDRSRLPAFFA